MIIDNFLTSYDLLQKTARNNQFEGVVNPADGVLYPDISVEIPQECIDEVQIRLDEAMERPAIINTIFMRLTSENTKGAPHQAHNDLLMGDYTLLLYLQEGEGGTSFVKHIETGMDAQPETTEQHDAWVRDTNVPEAWEVTELVSMKENRANIIRSERMHRAEPVNQVGFGSDQTDGRIVLIAFFT